MPLPLAMSVNGLEVAFQGSSDDHPSFTYDSDLNVEISSASAPAQLAAGSLIILSGSNFYATQPSGEAPEGWGSSSSIKAYLGGVGAVVIPIDATTLHLEVPELEMGTYQMELLFGHQGLASVAALTSSSFNISPLIDSITPTSGSVYGGTELTISGSGFPSLPQFIEIKLTGMEEEVGCTTDQIAAEGCTGVCEIISSSVTDIRCMTPRAINATYHEAWDRDISM